MLKTYDTKDAVPEAQRATAIETKDGRWAAEDVDPTLGEAGKRALQQERDAREREERARKTAEKELDDLKREQKAKAAGISEQELQKIRDDEAKVRKPIEDENTTLKADIRKLKLTDKVQALYLANGGMKDRLDDAMKALAERTDLGDKDGIVFKDKDGNVTTDDAAAFFAKHRKEKPWFYEGSGGSGSGSPGSGGGGGEEPPPAPPAEAAKDAKRREVANAF